ncbi:MAG: hypothetical protein JNL79_20120 [Myxococcales bacterium]|nr:hypothetical protein [Myxococcales bacterium]
MAKRQKPGTEGDGTSPKSAGAKELPSLRATIERALARDEPPDDLLPMLERLRRMAIEGSDDRRFADRRIAELLLETEPWRAALHIRRLVRELPDDDAHWALMGLAQALLGNHKFAAQSYRRALALDPGNPWYAHNLGHILDVGLDRARDGLPWLERAHKRIPDSTPVTCSVAHALFRLSRLDEARAVLAPLLRKNAHDPDVWAIARQLDRAEAATAPARRKARAKRRTPS